MDKSYQNLFLLIAQTTADLAELVMNNNKDEKSIETSKFMREDFLNLKDKIKENNLLTKADCAKLLVGTFLVIQRLEEKIKSEQKSLRGYKLDIIPKLDQINNTDESNVPELFEKLFSTQEKDEN